MKIAIFCPNLIGDTVMATPAIRALKENYPDASLIGVIKPHVAPTLDGAPWFDELIHFDPRSKNPAVRTRQVVQTLRQRRPDLAVLLPNSFRSAIVAWLSGASRRIGYGRSGRAILLTDRLDAPRDAKGKRVPTPIVESYLELVRRLNGRVGSLKTELFTTAEDEARASEAWSRLGLDPAKNVVCLNTGGAYGPAKSWPTDYFATLARRLAEESNVSVLAICGPSERDAAREIAKQAAHPKVVSLADEPLSIGLSKACVRRASLLITTDSGPRHFAAAFNTPVLTLFGPTHIAWTRTYHPHAAHLFHPVPCGPCQRPTCPLGHHRCMKELTPDRVFSAAQRFLV